MSATTSNSAGPVATGDLVLLRHAARRDGKAIYYSLSDPKAVRIVETVYEMFCKGM